MIKYTYLLFLLLLSAATFAQRADSTVAGDRPKTYAPGRWSVGLRYEYLPFRTHYTNTWAPGLVVGYNLLPQFSLQVGLTPTNLGKEDIMELPPPAVLPFSDNFTGRVNRYDYRPGLYVPLSLRYSLSKSFRRVQPYLLAQLHAYFGGEHLTWYTYENGQLTNLPLEKSQYRTGGLGATASFGLRIRTINRFFLGGEIGIGRIYQQNAEWVYNGNTGNSSLEGRRSYTALLGAGLTYEFK